MAIEIERKFLVKNKTWESGVTGSSRMVQGYLAVNDECGIRVRIADEGATVNIKSAGLQIKRMEFEYPIPRTDAQEMIDRLCCGRRVSKTRYRVDHGSRTWEIDVFDGRNSGLVVAEVELATENEPVDLPDWAGIEVSGQARYLNNNLATYPYECWTRDERSG